jgi:hypothetical protein
LVFFRDPHRPLDPLGDAAIHKLVRFVEFKNLDFARTIPLSGGVDTDSTEKPGECVAAAGEKKNGVNRIA